MEFHSKPNIFVRHVNIRVQDLKRSLTFYQEVLGFKTLEQTEQIAKLTADGKTSILSLEQQGKVVPKQGKTTGLYHFALLLPERSDLANVVHHFREIGLPFGAADHLVSEALYLDDPDGNGIEIYRDRNPSAWTWVKDQVAMTVDPLDIEDLLSKGKQQRWTGLPAGTIMGHLHLSVSDLEKAEEFYIDGLGFDIVSRFGEQALFISTGGYHHHLALNTWAGVDASTPPVNSVGLEAYTLTLPSEEARQNQINQLKNIGAIITEKNGSFVTHDPFENRIFLEV